MSCIFCKIISGDIPSQKVYEDEKVCAFRDINPQAPTHILIIPKEHKMDSAFNVDESNSELVAACFEAIAKIARQEGLERGFRVITNSGADGGQTVNHLHFHLLGGKKLGEKMV